MAMLGMGDYLCEACENFNSDGVDGNHPRCRKQSPWMEHHRAVKVDERCPYGFKFGVPCGYPVSMERNRLRAREIGKILGIEVGEQ